MSAQAYPLAWPIRVPRSPSRRDSQFGKHTISQAVAEVIKQVQMLGGRQIVISSNLRTKLDGFPFGVQAQPADTGVAVYFTLNGRPIVLPCDRWRKVEHNLWAIAKDVEAQRGRRRWGVGTDEQAFAGYAALPAPVAENPWGVLGIPGGSPVEVIEAAYREEAKRCHPDLRGGSHEAMQRLNRAREAARAEVEGRTA